MTLCDVYCDVPGISLQSHYVGVLDMYGRVETGQGPTFYQNVNMHGHGKQYCTVINRNLSTSLVCGKKCSVFLCLLQPSILPSR